MTFREELEGFGLRRERLAREEGRKEGRDEARVSARQLLVGALTERFGPLADDVKARVEAAGLEDLFRWSLRVHSSADVDEALAG